VSPENLRLVIAFDFTINNLY